MGLSTWTTCLRAAAIVLAATVLSSCGGGSPRTPSSSEPAVPPGTTRVTGSEQMAWQQSGGSTNLRFVAYVDGNQVRLDQAQCNDASPDAACSSPLPALTDGLHTLAVAAITIDSELESDRSESISVQKVSARSVISAASLPDAGASMGLVRVIPMADGRTVAADVVARGLTTPVQMAALPDGRVLVADDVGRIRMIHPAQPDRGGEAVDAGLIQREPARRPFGLAPHPAFMRNGFVFVAVLAEEAPGAPRLRVLRLREAGDTLGEPASVFEAPVTGQSPDAPRVAFGPDGLLYILLPAGVEIADRHAASEPVGAVLRLDEEGRVPASGPVSGVVSHPLAFGWHPSTSAPVALFAAGEDRAEAHVLDDTASTSQGLASAVPLVVATRDAVTGTLALRHDDAGAAVLGRVLSGALEAGTLGQFRLAAPIRIDDVVPGVSGTVVDVTFGLTDAFVAVTDPHPAGEVVTATIVRLRVR
jgi:hypothetical protein